MAEAFGKMNPGVQFKIGFSGTGGGFKKLCAGRVDIAGASRPINSIEDEECTAQHIEYIELPVAFDTLTLVVNAKNTFLNWLSINELRRMWEPAAEGTIVTWRDIRPSFPADPLVLFSPGKDSGTFDYFTLAVVGTEGKNRGDVTMSEDDTVIQRGVADNPSAIGYLGYSYYQGSREKLKLVSVDNGHGCIAPSTQTMIDATYESLSRPLFIYVNAAAAARPDIRQLPTDVPPSTRGQPPPVPPERAEPACDPTHQDSSRQAWAPQALSNTLRDRHPPRASYLR